MTKMWLMWCFRVFAQAASDFYIHVLMVEIPSLNGFNHKLVDQIQPKPQENKMYFFQYIYINS